MNIGLFTLHLMVEKATEQTWKGLDKAMHVAAFGSADDLSNLVASPDEFVKLRSTCVLLQSDQVPFYCKVRSDKQLYGATEFRKAGSRSDVDKESKTGGMSGGHDKSINSRFTQTRGTEHVNSDKYRITIELCHEIRDWFSDDALKTPYGAQGKHLLVLPGKHGDLSNINDEHRYIEDRRFSIKTANGELAVFHKAGEYTSVLSSLPREVA